MIAAGRGTYIEPVDVRPRLRQPTARSVAGLSISPVRVAGAIPFVRLGDGEIMYLDDSDECTKLQGVLRMDDFMRPSEEGGSPSMNGGVGSGMTPPTFVGIRSGAWPKPLPRTVRGLHHLLSAVLLHQLDMKCLQ
jgi:hypothetical protein